MAVLLTGVGMVPFLLLGGLMLLHPLETPVADSLLISYSAVVLSFVGAVHWGFALRDTAHPVAGAIVAGGAGLERQLLVFGVVPAAVGWVALAVALHFAARRWRCFAPDRLFPLSWWGDRPLTVMVAGNYLALRWGASIVVLIVLLVVLFALLSGMRGG